MDLKAMVEEAKKSGWARGEGTVSDVQIMAMVQKWIPVTQRSADMSPETVLRPQTPEEAKPASLSAKYGLGAQPLHSDGAHLADPPDVVILVATLPSATPTFVFRQHEFFGPQINIGAGIFRVDSGRETFLATASSRERLRFDPGCMTPLDARARAAATYFEGQLTNAHPFTWDAPNTVLLIDNRHALHARGAVVAGDEDRSLTRLAYRFGEPS